MGGGVADTFEFSHEMADFKRFLPRRSRSGEKGGECYLGEWNGGGWDEMRNAILNGISDAGVYTNPSGFQ
jgi:hypothetical protein